jgi:Fe-S-cluster-containing dehydrogenase component
VAEEVGFFTETTLCIGCEACRAACFLLRYATLQIPPELLKQGPPVVSRECAEGDQLHAAVAPPAKAAER